MMKYFIIILFVVSINLFPQNIQKSILYLKAESKSLIENEQIYPDSINSKNVLIKNHSIGNIFLQSLTGSVLGLGAGLIVARSFFSNSGRNAIEGFGYIILFPTSIILATATGVHLIAKFENPKNSFWQTVKYSTYVAVGGSATYFIISKKISFRGVALLTLTPLVGSLIYSNFVADWPEKNNNLKEVSFRKMKYSFKDYYDSRQLFRINILSIPF